MLLTCSWILVCSFAASCSIARVTFTPLDDGEPVRDDGGIPLTDGGLTPDGGRVTPEDCSAEGDEDSNGVSDCSDPSCVDAPLCVPPPQGCGNGRQDPGEQCDDGNSINGDACDNNCTTPRCGNEQVDPDEGCDEGPGPTATCNDDCTVSTCGDRNLNLAAREEIDPPTSPSQVARVNPQTCRYDFAAVNQLFCAGTCGTWGGGNGCQQEDADAFCKLKTGNPDSVASSFTAGQAGSAPGFCCPSVDPQELGCLALGTFVGRGVSLTVAVHDTDLRLTHGPGASITGAICTEP